MDFDKIKELGIESEDLQEILKLLDEMQSDYLERLEYAESSEERMQMEKQLDEIAKQYKLVKAELKKASGSKAQNKTEKLNIPVAAQLDDVKVSASSNDLNQEKKDKLAFKNDKLHEKELRKQVDQKKKESLQQQKEEKKEAGKELKKKVNEDKKIAENNNTSFSTSSDILGDALVAYHNGNYSSAFSGISNIVNDEKESEKYDKDKLGFAKYVLALMYKKGQGTKIDEQRANFWFEQGAKDGCPEACVECGLYWAGRTPQSVKEDEENVKNALKYFKQAVDGCKRNENKMKAIGKTAMEKYVGVCEKKSVLLIQLSQAYDYLDKLKDFERDAFIKSQIDKRKEDLKQSKKESKRKNRTNGVPSRRLSSLDGAYIIAKIISTLGFCIILMNGHEILPKVNAPRIAIFERSEIFNSIVSQMSINGYQDWTKIGIYVIIIGTFVLGFSKSNLRSSSAKNILVILTYVSAIVSLFLVAGIINSGAVTPEEAFKTVAIAMAGLIATKIPGSIIKSMV